MGFLEVRMGILSWPLIQKAIATHPHLIAEAMQTHQSSSTAPEAPGITTSNYLMLSND